MTDDPGKALTEEDREAAILAHFNAGGCCFPVQPTVAAPISEWQVLRKITQE